MLVEFLDRSLLKSVNTRPQIRQLVLNIGTLCFQFGLFVDSVLYRRDLGFDRFEVVFEATKFIFKFVGLAMKLENLVELVGFEGFDLGFEVFDLTL